MSMLSGERQPTPIRRRVKRVLSSSSQNLVDLFCATYPFPFDGFQRAAIERLSDGKSVLVAAPTGTGKTVVAEFAIWSALREGKRVFYTAPIKALSNQKFRDFRDRFGSDAVGLMTGDIVENPTAPIVVMTTEIYRNVLLELERTDHENKTEFAGNVATTGGSAGHRQLDIQLESLAYIIFDELHFMADPQRGPVWEECIIHSPSHVRFVGLSATVQNAAELVAWMSAVHAPTELVFHPERAVPLEDYFYYQGELHLVRNAQGQRVNRFPKIGGEGHRRSFRSWRWNEEEGELAEDAQVPEAPQPSDVLQTLRRAELLPCLYFLPGRKAVESAALSCFHLQLVSTEEQTQIVAEVDRWLDGIPPEDCSLEQTQQLISLLPLGIGYHHAGLLPAMKVLVETLFAEGRLRAVFATDTLAMGVNMPARSVVLGSLSKFDGTGMRLMTPNEYQQLTGRAGRRGKDPYGAAVLLYSPWDEFEPGFNALTRPLLPVMSAFTMRYNSVLNLWRPFGFERLRKIGAASFLEYQRRARLAKQIQKQKRKAAKRQDAAADEKNRDAIVELGGSVEHELIATTTVLRIFGYIGEEDDALTLRGRLLRAIFHPSGLILTELLLAGALDDLTSIELAEVVSWFVYDSDKPLQSSDVLTDRLKLARRAALAMAERVRRTEARQQLLPSPGINERFMGIALGWGQGFSLAALQQRITLAEGDILGVLNQTIDLLRQVESACTQIIEDSSIWSMDSDLPWLERRELRQRLLRLKASLALAARQLLRGTVAQSRSLPFHAAGLPTPLEIMASAEDALPPVT
jgi:ATP-dependent RNA helicase HelY